ncbi:hypothetical protein MAR_002560 [Mya arenaria]|uniref:ADAM cysteine-rich domain-containing protein n=1 Tax=Mya arenaria TaxID=6604 RepID=A0ABY7G6N7_MYAAR|nr:hypothetical protein MAR_002560 [Mya arenaria]
MMGPLMLLMLYLLYLEPTDAMRFPHIRIRAKQDLKLSINDISDDVPVVLQRGGKMVPYRVSSEAAAFYMDVSNKAAFIVWRAGDTDSDTFLFMSIRYNSVTGSGYSITLIYAGISIATRSTDAPYIEDNLEENYVDGRRVFLTNSVLPAFKDWGNKNLKPIYNFDVAMMFTNLFAQHDGTVDGTGENCSSADMYVMGVPRSMSSDDVRNIRQFSFSSCSMDYFTAYIKTLNTGENCLATRSANYNTSDLNPYLGDLAGQVYTPDQQCEYILGAGSYLSRITYQSNYSWICSRMNCVIPGTNGTYYYKLAWEGTTCGDGKMCSGGSCVTSSRAPAVAAEECMFGNNPGIVTYETVTCNELLAFPNTSYKCYQSYCLNDCCETCEQIRLKNVNTTDCDYGDKASWCETMSLSGCYNNDDVCCQSCPRRALGIQNCTYGDRSTNNIFNTNYNYTNYNYINYDYTNYNYTNYNYTNYDDTNYNYTNYDYTNYNYTNYNYTNYNYSNYDYTNYNNTNYNYTNYNYTNYDYTNYDYNFTN